MEKIFSKRVSLILVFVFVSFPLFSQVKVACVGNSITEGWNGHPSYVPMLQRLLGSEYIVQNDGKSGATMLKNGNYSYWGTGVIAKVLAFHPDIVTIMLGTNDTKPQNWDKHGSEFKADYESLIDTLSSSSLKPKIFLVLPSPVWDNPYRIRNEIIELEIPLIKEIAKERDLPVVDVNTPLLSFRKYFNDGVHPDIAGADTLASVISRSILSRMRN